MSIVYVVWRISGTFSSLLSTSGFSSSHKRSALIFCASTEYRWILFSSRASKTLAFLISEAKGEVLISPQWSLLSCVACCNFVSFKFFLCGESIVNRRSRKDGDLDYLLIYLQQYVHNHTAERAAAGCCGISSSSTVVEDKFFFNYPPT